MNKLTNYLLSGIVIGMIGMTVTIPNKKNNLTLEQSVQQKQIIENEIKTSIPYESTFNEINKFYYKSKNDKLNNNLEEKLDLKSNYTPTDSEILKLSQIIYAEAASQNNEAWSDIVQIVKNRKNSSSYPNSIEEVIYQPGAFSCIDDKNNNNWNQIIGKITMNSYEKMIFNNIKEEVKSSLTKSIPGKENIIAYHDWSINKPNDSYWNKLKMVHQEGKLIFYALKEPEIITPINSSNIKNITNFSN